MTNGKLLVVHCNCTAGLGETCSHVATLLWLIAVGVEKRVVKCDSEFNSIQFNLDFTDRVSDNNNRGENIEVKNESVLKGCL